MKVTRNYKLYGLLFLCFTTVAIFQTVSFTSKEAAKEPIVLYELEKSEDGFKPPPTTAPVPKTDPWIWIVRIGGMMTGVKTLLDIIDKLKKKAA
jgi:hypothetical protein